MTSASTAALPLFEREKRSGPGKFFDVERCKEQLNNLLSVLRDGEWHTARDLKVYGFSDRELRDLVENSEGRILSFPGSPGYKSFDHATIDEIEQSKALLNQGRAMIRRFLRYKKRYHRRK